MGVNWTKIHETSTVGDMPTTAAVTFSTGINAPGGPVEFVQLRYDMTWAATPVTASDIPCLINNLRIVLNGEVVHDFVAGVSDAASAEASQYGYLLNMTGGRVNELPNTDDVKIREGFINIPLGQQTPQGVNRYEITIGWAATAAGATITSGKLETWLKFNTDMQTTTYTVPATSFAHANSIEQVVCRIPQNIPGVVSALAIFNDTPADEYGSQGIRINSLSDFGIGENMYRSMSGELLNGIQFNAGSTLQTQTFATRVNGALVIPVFGLTGGDIVLSVDSNAVTTRRYVPIITSAVGKSQKSTTRQTQSNPGNTAKAIVKGNLS